MTVQLQCAFVNRHGCLFSAEHSRKMYEHQQVGLRGHVHEFHYCLLIFNKIKHILGPCITVDPEAKARASGCKRETGRATTYE